MPEHRITDERFCSPCSYVAALCYRVPSLSVPAALVQVLCRGFAPALSRDSLSAYPVLHAAPCESHYVHSFSCSPPYNEPRAVSESRGSLLLPQAPRSMEPYSMMSYETDSCSFASARSMSADACTFVRFGTNSISSFFKNRFCLSVAGSPFCFSPSFSMSMVVLMTKLYSLLVS